MPLEVRDYWLAKRFGFGYQDIQDSPAVWLDWLLSIDGVAAEIESKRSPFDAGGFGQGR